MITEGLPGAFEDLKRQVADKTIQQMVQSYCMGEDQTVLLYELNLADDQNEGFYTTIQKLRQIRSALRNEVFNQEMYILGAFTYHRYQRLLSQTGIAKASKIDPDAADMHMRGMIDTELNPISQQMMEQYSPQNMNKESTATKFHWTIGSMGNEEFTIRLANSFGRESINRFRRYESENPCELELVRQATWYCNLQSEKIALYEGFWEAHALFEAQNIWDTSNRIFAARFLRDGSPDYSADDVRSGGYR